MSFVRTRRTLILQRATTRRPLFYRVHTCVYAEQTAWPSVYSAFDHAIQELLHASSLSKIVHQPNFICV